MTNPTLRDLRWLLALESLVFLSRPAWELAAQTAAPLSHPIRFTLELLLSLTAAALLFHVLPAIISARLPNAAPAFTYLAIAPQILAYLLWIGIPFLPVPTDLQGITILLVIYLPLLTLASTKRAWILVPAFFAPLAVTLLATAVSVNLPGTFFASLPLSQSAHQDHLFIRAILLSAAPITAIGWHLGQSSMSRRTLW